MKTLHRIDVLLAAASLGAFAGMALPRAIAQEAAAPASTAPAPSKFRSAEDGAFDISSFIDEAYGFAPIAMPITEPAVGYGAALGLMFIDKPEGDAKAGFGRPNITGVGGMATENGTWMSAVVDVRQWKEDRVQTLAGGIYGSVNLDFYGIGDDSVLQDDPLTYNLEPRAGFAQAKFRLRNSRWWAGFGYAYASTGVSFEAPDGTPGLPDFESESHVGGLLPMVSFDSRDNIFTPLRGTYAELSGGVFSDELGSDDDFQRITLSAMHYIPLDPKLTLGLRGSYTGSFGEVPFYLRPFVSMRGVAAMRYQGQQVAQVEAEVRWQLWQRYSLVGFVGTGSAWNESEDSERVSNVVAGGVGIRYEIARKYGLHMGIDVAFGPDDTAFYVQVGSAWMRP